MIRQKAETTVCVPKIKADDGRGQDICGKGYSIGQNLDNRKCLHHSTSPYSVVPGQRNGERSSQADGSASRC